MGYTEADAIQIKSDEGIAKNLVLKVKNTPIFFYLIFPFQHLKKENQEYLFPILGLHQKKAQRLKYLITGILHQIWTWRPLLIGWANAGSN